MPGNKKPTARATPLIDSHHDGRRGEKREKKKEKKPKKKPKKKKKERKNQTESSAFHRPACSFSCNSSSSLHHRDRRGDIPSISPARRSTGSAQSQVLVVDHHQFCIACFSPSAFFVILFCPLVDFYSLLAGRARNPSNRGRQADGTRHRSGRRVRIVAYRVVSCRVGLCRLCIRDQKNFRQTRQRHLRVRWSS